MSIYLFVKLYMYNYIGIFLLHLIIGYLHKTFFFICIIYFIIIFILLIFKLLK